VLNQIDIDRGAREQGTAQHRDKLDRFEDVTSFRTVALRIIYLSDARAKSCDAGRNSQPGIWNEP